jgi:2-octaprenyl-6-methoxyphenol hydroxylase
MRPDLHDVIIVGGGPIGCALACAPGMLGRRVVLLEAKRDDGGDGDARTLALSWGSSLILKRLGIGSVLDNATPIRSIHVSQRGGPGRTELRADELALPALGYVVRYADLHQALRARAVDCGATLLQGSTATAVTADGQTACVTTSNPEATVLHGRLAIIADGSMSLGEAAGARFRSVDYRQSAIVGLVDADRPHDGRAYERFTAQGPVALLPHESGFALVWSCTPEQAPALMSLDREAFLLRLQAHFGGRAGRFRRIRGRAVFPLTLRFAANPVLPRTVMLGNAAQALHPIAGQGFNLGLRDCWELAQSLPDRREDDPGTADVLARYRRARSADRFAGIALTDALTRLFSNDFGPVAVARGCAIAALDVFPAAKRFLMRRMIFGTAL